MASGEGGLLWLYRSLDRILRPFEFAGLVVSAAVMFAIMVLVSMDALLRYALGNPLTFQYQLTESYMLVALIFMAASWGFRTGGFIRINGVAKLLPPLLSQGLLRLGLLVSAAYIGGLTWTAGGKFLAKFLSGETPVGGLEWPEYLSWVWVPAGLGLLTLRLVLTALGPASLIETRHDPDWET